MAIEVRYLSSGYLTSISIWFFLKVWSRGKTRATIILQARDWGTLYINVNHNETKPFSSENNTGNKISRYILLTKGPLLVKANGLHFSGVDCGGDHHHNK